METIKTDTIRNILDLSEETFRVIFSFFSDHEIYFTFRRVCSRFRRNADNYIKLKGIFLLSHSPIRSEVLKQKNRETYTDDHVQLLFVFSRNNKLPSIHRKLLPHLPCCPKYGNTFYRNDPYAKWSHRHYPSFGRMIRGKLVIASDCRMTPKFSSRIRTGPGVRNLDSPSISPIPQSNTIICTQTFYEYDSSAKKWMHLEPVHSKIHFKSNANIEEDEMPHVCDVGHSQILHIDLTRTSLFEVLDQNKIQSSPEGVHVFHPISDCYSYEHQIHEKSSFVNLKELDLPGVNTFLTSELFWSSSLVQLADESIMFVGPSFPFDRKYQHVKRHGKFISDVMFRNSLPSYLSHRQCFHHDNSSDNLVDKIGIWNGILSVRKNHAWWRRLTWKQDKDKDRMPLSTRPICIKLNDSIYIISRNRCRCGYVYRNNHYCWQGYSSEDVPRAGTFTGHIGFTEKLNILDGTVNETDYYLPFYVPMNHTIATDTNNTMAIIWYGTQSEQKEKVLIFTEKNGFVVFDDITPQPKLRDQIGRLTRII